MKKDLTLLIMSCDKYSDLWDGQIRLLEQNWPDREIETLIVTDTPTEKEYPGIQIISAGMDVEWSDRLAAALKQVKTSFVFITLDDYFLIKKVDDQSIVDLLNIMVKESIDYVRLFPRPKKATKKELLNYSKIHEIDIHHNYSVNLTAGIWKIEFLASTIRNSMNAWQFEVALHRRAQEYNANCAVSLRNEYRILDVVRKGRLLHKPARYFKRHPEVYCGNREVNSWEYEIKLSIQQLFARHLPQPIKKRVKAFMTKRGHKYYSDQY